MEPNEDPSEAAIRETEEEAGVKGVIKRCLGDFEVRGEVLCFFIYFLHHFLLYIVIVYNNMFSLI